MSDELVEKMLPNDYGNVGSVIPIYEGIKTIDGLNIREYFAEVISKKYVSDLISIYTLKRLPELTHDEKVKRAGSSDRERRKKKKKI